MKPALAIQLVLSIVVLPGLGDVVQKPDTSKSREYSVVAIEGRFAAYIGIAPVLLDAKLKNKKASDRS